MSVPAGFEVRRCRDEALIVWTSPDDPSADLGLVSRYWVLDVGDQRVVLVANTNVDATKETVERFSGIAESATFAHG